MPGECLVGAILRVGRLANGRLERPNNRGPWRQTASFKALRPNACGQSAWWKLARDILGVLRGGQTAGLLNALTRESHGPRRQTAGLKALTTNACGQSAWSKLPRGILRVGRLANGTLEQEMAVGGKPRSIEAFETNKNKFHTCGGPRRRPCLGEGRGRRRYMLKRPRDR